MAASSWHWRNSAHLRSTLLRPPFSILSPCSWPVFIGNFVPNAGFYYFKLFKLNNFLIISLFQCGQLDWPIPVHLRAESVLIRLGMPCEFVSSNAYYYFFNFIFHIFSTFCVKHTSDADASIHRDNGKPVNFSNALGRHGRSGFSDVVGIYVSSEYSLRNYTFSASAWPTKRLCRSAGLRENGRQLHRVILHPGLKQETAAKTFLLLKCVVCLVLRSKIVVRISRTICYV